MPSVDDAYHQVELAALTSPQVERLARKGAILVVPVGSTEQHGPHLPLSTDTDIAVQCARALALRRPGVVVAPALAYGSSGEHQGFAGTLSIGQDATRIVLIELVRSATETFRRVLLVIGHGGNADPVNAAVAALRDEGRDVLAWAPRFPGDAHAGKTETSLMMALQPDRVEVSLATTGTTAPVAELMPQLRQLGVLAVSSTGVLGDPAQACVVFGEAIFAAALEVLEAFVDQWGGLLPGAPRVAPGAATGETPTAREDARHD